MSFSTDVKKEVININSNLRHCVLSEIYGLLLDNCKISLFNDKFNIIIKSENKYFVTRLNKLLKEHFNFTIEVRVILRNSRHQYELYVLDCLSLLLSLKIFSRVNGEIIYNNSFNEMLLKENCCKASFLRGLFLANGSINDPNKHNHIEFVRHSDKYLENIVKTFDFFQLNCKITNRKDYNIIYIKNGESLSDFLGLIGAHISLLEFENTKVFKDLRNNINRKQNCDIANLNKTINAAIAQIEDINYIIDRGYFEKLPMDLREIIDLRLSDTDITLKEIGERLNPPISKSSVYYKFKKINKIAKKLRL